MKSSQASTEKCMLEHLKGIFVIEVKTQMGDSREGSIWAFWQESGYEWENFHHLIAMISGFNFSFLI